MWLIGKVKECNKGIGLKNIFRNLLWKNKKVTDFFNKFLYFS